MSEIVVIDAGVGNLGNLKRAVERVGAPARITDDPDVVAASRRLVLPGVYSGQACYAVNRVLVPPA